MFVLGTTIGLGTWVLSCSDHIKQELLIKVYFKDRRDAEADQRRREKFDPKINPWSRRSTSSRKHGGAERS